VQTTTEEAKTRPQKISNEKKNNSCHGCLKQQPSPPVLPQLNSLLPNFYHKEGTNKLSYEKLPLSKHLEGSVATRQTSASVRYLVLLIIWLTEVYDPTHAHTAPIIMMTMHRIIWNESEKLS
jgi:hypothetical protein